MDDLLQKLDASFEKLKSNREGLYYMRTMNLWRALRAYATGSVQAERTDAALEEFDKIFQALSIYAELLQLWL